MTLEYRRRQRSEAERLAYHPTISVITPLYNTPPDALRRTLSSVRDQTYPFWQHCLVDDASSDAWIAPYLERCAAGDSRITFRRREENGGIVAASNDALELADGEFVAMLDHDDEVAPHALYAVACLLQEQPDVDLIYSDVDLIGPDGTRRLPFWKSDWSPDRLLSINYLAHLYVYHRAIVEAVGGFRDGFDGAQDYDLALRVTERTDRIFHVPDVLYHWRMGRRSAAGGNAEAKPYAYAAARRALVEHLGRRGLDARVEDGVPGISHRVRFAIEGEPLVTLVVAVGRPGQGLWQDTIELFRECLGSVARGTDYRRYEVVAVTPATIQSAVQAAVAERSDVNARVAACDDASDYGQAMNAGAAVARGEYLVFLGEPLEVLTRDWLVSMLEHAQREEIGAVGPKIYAASGAIEHAGIVIPNGVPRQIHRGEDAGSLGHRASLMTLGNYLAVSGACLMTRRAVFDRLGGFEAASRVGYSDVDYCLRLREHGCRALFTPHAGLRQIGSPGMDRWLEEGSLARFRARWAELGPSDPYYNRNLDPERADFTEKLGRQGRPTPSCAG